MDTLTVGEVARISGVTVRTLHHYDDIGLLRASNRTEAGYRLYEEADVDRLRAILSYRELGLGLEEIAEAVDRPESSIEVLRDARRRIDERIVRLGAIADNLDTAIAAHEEGTTMTPEEKLSVFGDFDPAQHEQEARERWGDTDAYTQASTRTAGYGKEDWQTIMAEAASIYQRCSELGQAGVPADSPEAAAVVEEHREHISRWFYDCTPEIHVGLGQMYVADERFRASIDEHGEGAAAYLSAAITAAYGG